MNGSSPVLDHGDQTFHLDGQVESHNPVSKAGERSTKPNNLTSPRSAANRASQTSFRTLVSVDWNLLYVNCRVGRKPCFFTCVTSLRQTSRSQRDDFARKCQVWPIDFRICWVGIRFVETSSYDGMTLTLRQQLCCRDVLHIAVRYGNSSGRNCLTMVVSTGSRAHDFEVPLSMITIGRSTRLSLICHLWPWGLFSILNSGFNFLATLLSVWSSESQYCGNIVSISRSTITFKDRKKWPIIRNFTGRRFLYRSFNLTHLRLTKRKTMRAD